jgi:hypothetical protein
VKNALLALALALVAIVAVAAPALAANTVAAKQQLRGHLPDLGETPSLRTFATASAYDTYRTSSGQADVFPASDRLFMSWDKELLALYARGNDSGGRCLRSGAAATLTGDAVTLDLQWEAGTCGAPATAHYPFVLVSLARVLDDGSSWIQPSRTVCAAPPGVTPIACASVSTTGSPAPTGAAPTATASVPTATPSAPTTPGPPIPSQTRAPSPTVAAAPPSPLPTPASTAAPSASVVAVPNRPGPGAPAPEPGPDLFLVVLLIAIGFGLGAIFVLSTRRSRR